MTTFWFSAFVIGFVVFLLVFSYVIYNNEEIVSKSHKEWFKSLVGSA